MCLRDFLTLWVSNSHKGQVLSVASGASPTTPLPSHGGGGASLQVESGQPPFASMSPARAACIGTIPPAQEMAGQAVAVGEEGGWTLTSRPCDHVLAGSSTRLFCPTWVTPSAIIILTLKIK